MSRHEDRVSMQQMLDHAREAVEMAKNKTRNELEVDRMLELALTKLVEIVGVAANRVSKETQQRHSQIPWSQIIGMRNRLVHGYDAVDLNILWDIVQEDLPPVIAELEKILGENS